eukprot:jgi/Chlat1/714/Chrsp104S01198
MGWWIGAVLNLIGSICINFGTNLIKLGHNQRDAYIPPASTSPDDTEDDFLRRLKPVVKPSIHAFVVWRFGLVAFIFGNVLNFVSFGYAAQSLLAALGSVQFVSNVVFASVVLKERITFRYVAAVDAHAMQHIALQALLWTDLKICSIVAATCLIVAGNFLLVWFGNHESRTYTVEELLAFYQAPVYLVYMGILVAVCVGFAAIYRVGRRKAKIAQIEGQQLSAMHRNLLPFSYAMVSGIIGTQSVLLGKSLSILMRRLWGGDPQLVAGWFAYVVLFFFLISSAFWMARLNKALSLFDAVVIVPMLQVAWTLFSILSGGTYFEEYKVFDGLEAPMFCLGFLIIMSGVVMLAPKSTTQSAERGPRPDGWKNYAVLSDEDDSTPRKPEVVTIVTKTAETQPGAISPLKVAPDLFVDVNATHPDAAASSPLTPQSNFAPAAIVIPMMSEVVEDARFAGMQLSLENIGFQPTSVFNMHEPIASSPRSMPARYVEFDSPQLQRLPSSRLEPRAEVEMGSTPLDHV